MAIIGGLFTGKTLAPHLEREILGASEAYAYTRSVLRLAAHFGGLSDNGNRVRTLAFDALERMGPLVSQANFFTARASADQAIASGHINTDQARVSVRTWHDDLLIYRDAGQRLLRSLRIFNQSDDLPKLPAPPAVGTVTPVAWPTNVLIDATNRCNFRCVSCGQSSDQNFAQFDLAWLDLRSLWPVLAQAKTIHLAGNGEPLLSGATPEIIAAGLKGDAHISMTTNGSLLKRLNVPEGEEHRFSIGLSFDGGYRKTVEFIRRGFDWERVTRNIEALRPALRSRIVLAMTVVRQNHAELPALAELARRFEIPRINLQQFAAFLPWHSEMQISPAEWDRLQSDKAALTSDPGFDDLHIDDFTFEPQQEPARAMNHASSMAMLATVRPVADALATTIEAAEKLDALAPVRIAPELVASVDASRFTQPASEAIRIPHCAAPWMTVNIHSDGGIRPCCSIGSPLGSLAEESFDDIWDGPGYRALRASLLDRETVPPICRGCQDSTRFTHLFELVETLKRERPDGRLAPVFDIAELPAPARRDWDRSFGHARDKVSGNQPRYSTIVGAAE